MKKSIFFASVLLIFGSAAAQIKFPNIKNWRSCKHYVNSSFGYYFPLNAIKQIDPSANGMSFQLQMENPKKLMLRLFFDQTILGYEFNTTSNNLNINVDEKIHALSIGVDIGYYLKLNNKFTSIMYAGLGNTTFHVPKFSYNPSLNSIDVRSSDYNKLSVRSGVVFQLELSKYFVIYTDLQLGLIPHKTELSNASLESASIQFGFKTPLQ